MARWDRPPGMGGLPGGMLDDIGRLAKSILASRTLGGGSGRLDEPWGAVLTGGTGYNPQLGGNGVPPSSPQMPQMPGGFQEGGMGIQIGRGPQMTGRPTLYEDGSMMNPFTNPRSAGLPQQGPLPGQRPVGQLSPQLLMILMQMQQASNERRRRMMQSKFPTLF